MGGDCCVRVYAAAKLRWDFVHGHRRCWDRGREWQRMELGDPVRGLVSGLVEAISELSN